MRQARRVVGGAAALGAVAAATVLIWPMAAVPAGPLGRDLGAPNRIAFDVELGRPFTYGLLLIRNPGARPATIEAVELDEMTPGIALVDAAVRPLSEAIEHGLVANDRTYPPPALAGHLAPAVGAVVEHTRDPSDGVELVLGLRVDAPGRHGFAGVAVAYRVDGVGYRVVYPAALEVCAPPSAGTCVPSG